eukprot:TRINITY_DN6757_c0_g1_i1.p1 TRINITY_DN6757_c0_g1~~TRINITY_DN6757_c0_g1_i1.p1  ORF type:complete len:645 (+),score=137.06 TRINITY_DN6757_c0_g1_i1:276-2210(+)
MECMGICCSIGNYYISFDSGVNLFIYGDIISALLAISLLFLLLKLHVGYASTEESSKNLRAALTRIISSPPDMQAEHAPVDEYGRFYERDYEERALTNVSQRDTLASHTPDTVLPIFYALTLIAALWFACEAASLFLPQNNGARIALRILYDGHTILDNWPIIYAFFPPCFPIAALTTTALALGLYSFRLAVTYFLFHQGCSSCSLFFPDPKSFYVYMVYVLVYAAVLLSLRYGRPPLRPRKTIHKWVMFLTTVWAIAATGSALLLFLDNDIGFCLINFDALLYTVAYAPLLYSTFMAESRLIRYQRSGEASAALNLYGSTTSVSSDGQDSWGGRVLQESAEADAKSLLRRYPNITWINVKQLQWGKKIGKGGMGEVFLAQWNGTAVALKKLFRGEGKNVADFFKEATVMSKLSHPNIVLFMGVSVTAAGDYIIVTEFVSGGSLWDIMHPDFGSSDEEGQESEPAWGEGAPQDPAPEHEITRERAHRILVQTVRGMAYLHSLNPPIIHRDLKSQNLLLTEDWNVKVADFGLARVQVQNTMTATGTPQWSAPEVIRREHYTTAADVFSFGIILYEVLTGAVPYRHLSAFAAAHAVAYSGLRPSFPAGTDPAYVDLASRCWQEEADFRPTFDQLVEELDSMPPPIL